MNSDVGQRPEPPPPLIYLSFSAEISRHTISSLLNAASAAANKGVEEVYLLLSTRGGDMLSGITLYNVLRGMPFKLTTHNVAAVDSVGVAIFLAGEERFACSTSSFLLHSPYFDVTQQVRFEEAFLRERAESLRADRETVNSIVLSRTRLEEAEIDSLFQEGSILEAGRAKDAGLIHGIREVSIPSGTPVHNIECP